MFSANGIPVNEKPTEVGFSISAMSHISRRVLIAEFHDFPWPGQRPGYLQPLGGCRYFEAMLGRAVLFCLGANPEGSETGEAAASSDKYSANHVIHSYGAW